MSNPYDPHSAPTSFPGQQPPPPQTPPYPQQYPPQPPPQQYPPQPPPGGGYGQGPGGPGFGAPGGYGAPGYGGPPPKSKTPLIIGAVVLALVLIGGAVGGFFLLTGSDDDGDDRASDDSSQSDEPSESEEPSEDPATEDPIEEPTEATEDPSEPVDPGGFDPALTPVVGLWAGTYTCGQGVSKLDLAIAPGTSGDGSLDAVFEFGPTSDNPDVPEGSYLMTGFLTGGTLALNGYQWIEQPPDYGFVDLVATVEGELPETIEGDITSPGCGSFSITRTTG